MANLMPGEWDWQVQDAQRKRKFAEALKQQQQPQGQMVGGIFVAPSWTQRLASALGQYQSGQMMREADKLEREAYDKQRETLKTAGERLLGAFEKKQVQDGETVTTAPYVPEQMDRFGSPLAGVERETVRTPIYKTVAPTTDDILSAYLNYGQEVGDPSVMGTAIKSKVDYMQNMEKQQADREQRAQELIIRLQDARATAQEKADLQRELTQMQIDAKRDLAEIAANNRKGADPYFQAIPTSQGYARFNARTGQMEPIDMGTGAILPAAQDPKLQGDITQAKEQAKADVELGVAKNQAVRKSDQMLEVAKQAQGLLDKNPTGSGMGSIVDAVGRSAGISTEGSKTAAELETLSGWLVANVPRMEGPQSNFDLQNYQIMAGKVGDRTVPVAERKAALNKLIELQEKYKAINAGAPANAAPAPKGRKIEVDW